MPSPPGGKALVQRKSRGTWAVTQVNHSLHLACTLYISITMLGYWLLLGRLYLFLGNRKTA